MEEILALSETELIRLNERLTRYAYGKMFPLTWRGVRIRKSATIPSWLEPQDFAQEAIRRMLDGTRRWNRKRYPTVEEALKSIIDSHISQIVNQLDNKKFKQLKRPNSDDESTSVYEIESGEDGPIRIAIDDDWRDWFRQQTRQMLQGESQLVELLKCMESGITKPAEIAQKLKTNVKDINNLKKRLRRKLETLDPGYKPTKKKVVS